MVRRDPGYGFQDGVEKGRLAGTGAADDQDILAVGNGFFDIVLVIGTEGAVCDVFSKSKNPVGLFTDVELGIADNRRDLALEPGPVSPDFGRNTGNVFVDDFTYLTGKYFDNSLDLVG